MCFKKFQLSKSFVSVSFDVKKFDFHIGLSLNMKQTLTPEKAEGYKAKHF